MHPTRLQVLDEMESIATGPKDKPTTVIKLVSAHIFVDAIADKRDDLIGAEKDRKKAAKEAEKSKVCVFGYNFWSISCFTAPLKLKC